MLRDDGVALIQEQLAFRTTLASNIITHLQLAQTMLENGPTKPWFLFSEDSFRSTFANDQRIPVPDDFLEEADEAVLRYVPSTVSEDTPEVDLVKDDYDTLRTNYQDTSTGTTRTGSPEAYCLMGDYFRIFPVPDAAYLLRMIYYKQDTVLSSNVENGWLKYVPYLLLGKALKQISGGPLRDKDAFSIGDAWEKEGRAILAAKEVSRNLAGRNLQMGGPH